MKQFISTKLFLTLQEASQSGIDRDAKVLKNGYDEFVMLLFSEKTAFTDKTSYHNELVYTRVELASLTEVSGKKCSYLHG
ncbi:MAG: hypothetical protein LBI82_04640 [Dysgonamonadaceae bacterium]|jgi:hypothetical protein|nr:hypothetical protein [Dysgonamonadaceae bacterium]